MTISKIYTSDTNLFNNYRVNSSIQHEQKAMPPKVENSDENKKIPKKLLYFGVGVAAILSAIVLRGRKLVKDIQKIFTEIQTPRCITAVSIPDNKPIDVDVVDTRFLRRNSKLRVRPEVEDVEFTEIN